MRKQTIILIMSSALMLSACTGQGLTKESAVASTDCEVGGLIFDNDKTPDWEIDLDGDCEGDIEFEGNEKRTKQKPGSKAKPTTKTKTPNSTKKPILSKPIKIPKSKPVTTPKTSTSKTFK